MLHEQRPSEPIRDPNWKLPFGRWKGFAISEVMEHDAGYVLWLIDNTDIDLHADLLETARDRERLAEARLYGDAVDYEDL